jgi:hypothetical protein
MDVQITYRPEVVVCDTGRHAGMTRVDLRASVYLTDDELAEFERTGLSIALIKGT